MGHPQRLVHRHRQRQGGRAQLYGGRSERVGCLARIAAVDLFVAHGTATDRDVKAFPDGLPDDFVLILRFDLFEGQGASTRTASWRRHRDHFVDMVRNRFAVAPPICRAGLTAWALRRGLPRAAGKRRRLPLRGPLRLLELAFEPLVFLPQLISLAFQTFGTLAPLSRSCRRRSFSRRVRRHCSRLETIVRLRSWMTANGWNAFDNAIVAVAAHSTESCGICTGEFDV
jgi:hypothetical protein